MDGQKCSNRPSAGMPTCLKVAVSYSSVLRVP
jgi:hypothetical protein